MTAQPIRLVLSRGMVCAAIAFAIICKPVEAQQPAKRDPVRDSVFAMGITAGEADGEHMRRTLLNALKFNLGFTTVTIGGGYLQDGAAYGQDSLARSQIEPHPDLKMRDARILLGGRFKTKRAITWQAGVMYDQVKKKGLFRQTGIMVAVPEISSHFFVGRAKEGFSLNKVMTGYDGWTMERMTFTDAVVPLLADGFKWLASFKDNHFFWNLGAFTDVLSEGQSFSSYDHQYVARFGWVPFVGDTTPTLLHIGINLRRGAVDQRQLQLKSKPESFAAPNYIDTGKFPAKSAQTEGYEIYYRPGKLLLGSEYYWQQVNSVETHNPSFHGGDVFVSWLVTGEKRAYNTVGHYFKAISPDRPVIQGGPGAWEVVLRYSYSDLNSDSIQGGIFWRITPMVNWHMTDNLRLEAAYGYGKLHRFGTEAVHHFMQARIQFQMR